MFRDAKVGDRVWSPIVGWGKVIQKDEAYIWVDDGKGVTAFHIDGKYWEVSVAPSLFWDEIKIDPPPRPKRKVKKSNTVYLVPFKCTVSTFFSEELAIEVARNYDAVSPIVPFTYEWEEEE